MKASILLFSSLLMGSSLISQASGAALPEAESNAFSINADVWNAAKLSSYSGPDFFDTIINDPEIPFTEPHGNDTVLPDVTDAHTLKKRALKRYNYLKFKVTLTGNVNHVLSTLDAGSPYYFRCTSADLYIFDRINGRNARDLVLVWRDPNGGNAVPGTIFWMTNRRLFSFLKPTQWDEPVSYRETVPTIWNGYNQLLAFETRIPGDVNYNGRNQFTPRPDWFLQPFLPVQIRNGGVNIKWEDGPKRIWGAIDVRTLGYPYNHDLYVATIDGKFQSKGYRFL